MKSKMMKRKQIAYDCKLPIGESATFSIDGSCMDSSLSPIRLKDGQRMLVHPFPGVFSAYADIEKVRGKVCVIQYLQSGKRYFAVKQVAGFDEIADSLRLVYYYPERTEVSIRAGAIERLYIVDGVMVQE